MGGTTTDSPARRWASLPEELRAKLRLGFTGKAHLLDVAGWCLRSGDPDLSTIAADALETAVRENPLDGAMARDLLAQPPVRALLSPATADRLARLADHWQLPSDLNAYRRLQESRDFGALKAFSRDAAAGNPDNLFWLEQAVVAGCMNFDHVFVADILKNNAEKGVESIFSGASGRVEALFCHGATPEDGELRRRAVRRFWDAGLVLRAHDRVAGVAERREICPVPWPCACIPGTRPGNWPRPWRPWPNPAWSGRPCSCWTTGPRTTLPRSCATGRPGSSPCSGRAGSP